MFRKNVLTFMVILGAITGLASTNTVLAAACKGMEKAKCETTDGCYWVDPYKRKDGVEVSGHCRGKPGSKKGNGNNSGAQGGAGSGGGSSTKSESKPGNGSS